MTDAVPEVVLVRHGETEWSASGRHTGRTDVPLTERGRRQAACLADLLGKMPGARILSSPLSRAWDTMEGAGFEDRADPDPDLMEWDYGIYEGRTTDDIRHEIPGWSVWSHPIPDGETVAEVGARADRVIERLLDGPATTVLFAHAHLLRVLGARWIGLPPSAGSRLELNTASVSTLGWERETRAIVRWNRPCRLATDEPLL